MEIAQLRIPKLWLMTGFRHTKFGLQVIQFILPPVRDTVYLIAGFDIQFFKNQLLTRIDWNIQNKNTKITVNILITPYLIQYSHDG